MTQPDLPGAPRPAAVTVAFAFQLAVAGLLLVLAQLWFTALEKRVPERL